MWRASGATRYEGCITAVTEAIAFVEKKHRTYPHEFSYEETVQTLSGRSVRQRVELTLWDAVSIREHAIGSRIQRGAWHDSAETLARRAVRGSAGAALRRVQRNGLARKELRGGAFLVSGTLSPSCLPTCRSACGFRCCGQA